VITREDFKKIRNAGILLQQINMKHKEASAIHPLIFLASERQN